MTKIVEHNDISVNKNTYKSKIAHKFIFIVLFTTFIITLIGAIFSIYSNYHYQLKDANDRLQRFEEVELSTLANTLLIGDRVQLQTEMLSIIAQPDIEYIKVTRIGKNSIILTENGFNVESANNNRQLTLSTPITNNINGNDVLLGTLELVLSLESLYQQLYVQSIGIAIEGLIEMSVEALVILFFFSLIIGKHLTAIISYANKIDLGSLDQTLTLERKNNSYNDDDELSHLSKSINNMREKLSNAFQEIKLADGDREKLIQTLEDKNGELERFTYTVSHDLKSPLVTINGFIGLLEEDIAEGDTKNIKNSIKTIKDAAKTMHALLNDLLELSRVGIKKGQRIDLNFNDLITDVLNSLAEQIKSKNAHIEVQENFPLVTVEKMRFDEVFLNLIENSLKYMENQPSPRVKVGFELIENTDGTTETVFFVKDNGRGIEAQYCTQVFELFERVAVDVDGTGVGLAIVKRIIEVHDGRIWVESEGQGKGATFYFVVPVITPETTPTTKVTIEE